MRLADVLLHLIEKGPGRKERELAQAIYGRDTQQLVNQDCRILGRAGKIERRGGGGPTDPYRYYPIETMHA
jgi:hypothetical protein